MTVEPRTLTLSRQPSRRSALTEWPRRSERSIWRSSSSWIASSVALRTGKLTSRSRWKRLWTSRKGLSRLSLIPRLSSKSQRLSRRIISQSIGELTIALRRSSMQSTWRKSGTTRKFCSRWGRIQSNVWSTTTLLMQTSKTISSLIHCWQCRKTARNWSSSTKSPSRRIISCWRLTQTQSKKSKNSTTKSKDWAEKCSTSTSRSIRMFWKPPESPSLRSLWGMKAMQQKWLTSSSSTI